MVCRENKGRSAMMGVGKISLRQAGLGDFSDHEIQSMLHEQRHRYTDMGPTNAKEYVSVLKGARQQIIDDPTISDADKFRPSKGRGSQPGIVTRLDEELERFRTGKRTLANGDKVPLTKAQMNVGADYAAMQRLVQPLARAQEAKEHYFELYSRQTGTPLSETRSRFRELVDRPKTERDNTEISLRDGWRDDLAVAGLSADQQADMGQSNQTREALRIMESERISTINSLPTRSALRAEHRIPVLPADDPAAKVQCVNGCGQFGHPEDDCPNAAEVEAVNAASAAYDTADAEFRQQEAYAHAANYTALHAAGEPIGDELPDGNRYVVDPRTGEQQQVTDEQMAQWATDAQHLNKRQLKRAQKARNEAAADLDTAQQNFETARGPVPWVSSWVRDAAYNPDTGTMYVKTADYQLKSGEERPGRVYLRRVSQDEYNQLMSAESLGAGISRSVFARAAQGGSERFRAANPDELREMSVERMCPTCGQFASFTQDHRCAVTGSMDTREEHVRIQARLEAEHLAQTAKLPVKMVDSTKRFRVTGQARANLPDGGRFDFPAPRETDRINRDGAVAGGTFGATYLGAQVKGQVHVWNDKRTGRAAYRVSNMKCSCGRDECRHAAMAAAALSKPYGATRSYGTPGAPLLTAGQPTAPNRVYNDPDTMTYEQIKRIRDDAATEQVARFRKPEPGSPERVAPLPASRHGMPVDDRSLPTQWNDGVTDPVDVTNPDAVADRVRSMLNERTGRTAETSNWKVTADPAGGVWVRSAESAHPATPGHMTNQHQSELAAAFNLPTRPRGRGVYVPPVKSWRHEMLDRLAGTDSGIKGARFAPKVGDDTRN